MKGLVIYKGKYGATKQYAMWIGQELRLPVGSADRFPVDMLPDYDYFILGSSVYTGKLEIRHWLKKNYHLMKNKPIFLFQVAGAPVDQKEKRDGFNQVSVPINILDKMQVFYLPGRMLIRNLGTWDRFMLKMGARLTKDPVEKQQMLTDFDHVKKGHIFSLLESVRNLEQVPIAETELA